jgi:hypothetical protein
MFLSCDGKQPVAANPWKTYKYPGLGFAVDLPAEPQVQKAPVVVGPAACSTTTIVDRQGSSDTLMVSVTDCNNTPIPEELLHSAAGLRRLAGGIAGRVGGMLLDDAEYEREGVRGRRYTGRNAVKGFSLKFFTLVSGKRIYLLGEIGNSNDLDREVQSFTFQVH